MTLSEYLAREGITASEMSRRLGVSPMTIHRYLRGDRIPHEPIMRAIVAVTGGAVTPNDFFDLDSAA